MLRKKKAPAAAARQEEEKANAAAGGVPVAPRRSPGQIRLTKDMQDLDKPTFIEMRVDQANIMQFGLTMDLSRE